MMTTYTVTWDDGELVASNHGDVIRREPWAEPITAQSDSHAIANAILGDKLIVGVDHDGEFVHVHADNS
jgi:hypothetical protein